MGWAVVAGMVATVVALLLWAQRTGPLVPPAQVAEEDLGLVREGDRTRWRRLRLRVYRNRKRQDDSYRIAAFQKLVDQGVAAEEARASVRRDFPFYYSDPATRDAEGFAGDDGALPVILMERVDGNARVLKELMAERQGSCRTMNALVRTCMRKGAI
jgi:hypothetical protein